MKDHRAYWDMLEEEYCDCLTGLALKLREMEDTQALIAESERMELDAAQAERAYALFLQKWQAQEKGAAPLARHRSGAMCPKLQKSPPAFCWWSALLRHLPWRI